MSFDDLPGLGVLGEPAADLRDPGLPLVVGQRQPLVLARIEGQ